MVFRPTQYYGPPIRAFNECLIRGADGVTRAGACSASAPVETAAVATPAPGMAAATPAVQQANWLLIAAIVAGIYLLTKG